MRILILFCSICCFILACNNRQETNNQKSQGNSEGAVLNKDALYGDLYTYYCVNPQTQFEKDQNSIIEYCAEKVINPKRIPTGVFMLVEKNGRGPVMKWGEQVTAHYKGYFLDGRVFDSSYQKGKPITFKIGGMIKGWNDVLIMLSRGARVKLWIPSALAYGEKGFPGYVPPNTPLIFDIEVLP